MVFNSVLVLFQLLGGKYNVALLLLCTYEKQMVFFLQQSFGDAVFGLVGGFMGRG